MSNPSRFDRAELLSATGGWFFRNECLRPQLNIMQVEVRTKEERAPFLPNTKAILLLGKDAFTEWTGDKEHTLGEVRGSIYYINGIPAISSYLPQDCMDAVDYESTHNELLQGKDYSEEGVVATSSEKRRHGVTARSNWRFWLQKDTEKIIRILLNGGAIPETPGHFKPSYRYYPNAKDIIDELNATSGKNIYIDLETDENFGLKCIGYSCDSNIITIVPVVDHSYRLAYPEVPEILRAFCAASKRNTLVAHNGSGFDFLVLPWKYKMSIGYQLYDTMLATHRCFPDIEKSLGHCTSLWTYEPFHKDEGGMSYGTIEDSRRLWQYCAKDVYTMMLIKRAIDYYAKSVQGLEASIAQVMRAIPAYRLMTLQGIHFKQKLLDETMRENDGLMNHYNNLINYLVGEEAMAALNRKSKKSLAGSNAKCVQYFHEMP